MKSKVYFTRVGPADGLRTVAGKLGILLEKSKVLDFIRRNERVAVKIHFGEEGNTGFVNPAYARVICDKVSQKGAKAFLADTNTLYRGKRTNSTDHLALARAHGFTRQAVGADIVIPEDTKKEDLIDVPINKKSIQTAKLARVFTEADAIVAVTHFKGHMITGFGGVLKNLGMGCASREGKLAQHCDLTPVFFEERCNGCGECEKVCLMNAIRIENNKAVLDESKCTGCANCIAACSTYAMFIDMKVGRKVQEKMVEYAYAALQGKQTKAGFVNFALNINKECDCWSEANPRIAPDVGILASADPVSIDKACLDLVAKACGKDVFKEHHPDQDGTVQLKYAQELGLGSLDYELVELRLLP